MRQNFNSWVWFALKNQEELYNVISSMIEDKIKDLVPQIVENCLRENKDSLIFDIQANINGRYSSDLKNIITEMILNEI